MRSLKALIVVLVLGAVPLGTSTSIASYPVRRPCSARRPAAEECNWRQRI